jgi:hypothetical protein
MSFRAFNQRWLHPAFQTLMILGIVALCQPWNLFLHRYGVTLILFGLVGFMITGKIGPAAPRNPDGAFDVSDHHDGKAGGSA